MENVTALDRLPTEDLMEIARNITEIAKPNNPYFLNKTNSSLLHIYNSTQTNWPTDDSVEDKPSLAALWIYMVIRLLWGVLAMFGNSLTIFAVTRYERLQTCTNYLICSLAISDLLSGLGVPLILVHELYPNSWFFITVCLFQQTMALISLAGNMLSLLYLSVDRYIYIAFPLRYQALVTPQRILIVLTVTWVYCLISIPTMVFTENHLTVGMACRSQLFLNKWVMTFYNYPQIILIMFLTIGFHMAIARIAHNQARQIAALQQPYNTLDVAINKSTKRISRTLGMVLGVYLFFNMPQLIMSSITFNNLPLESFEKYTVALHWTNTWVNPIIYAWRLKDFRIAFKKIFTGAGSFIEVPGIPV